MGNIKRIYYLEYKRNTYQTKTQQKNGKGNEQALNSRRKEIAQAY